MKPPTWLSRTRWSSCAYAGDDSFMKTPRAPTKKSTQAANLSDHGTDADCCRNRRILLRRHGELLVDRARLRLRAVHRHGDRLLPVRGDRRVERVEEAAARRALHLDVERRRAAVRG